MFGKIRMLGRCIIFLILTLLTQIGGVVYLAVLIFAKVFGWKDRAAIYVVFIIVYASASFATSYIAPAFGRFSVPCSSFQNASLKIANPIFCALNRQYVNKDVLVLLERTASAMDAKFAGTQTLVLDANFPFFDGFPLLPHLSHHDGRKVDLAFYYQNNEGAYLSGVMKSPIGYWGYTQPPKGIELPCDNFNSWLSLRWDMAFLQDFLHDYELEPQRTTYLLNWLVSEGQKYGFQKALLEPHLKIRLGLESDLIRFQGCRAARHDDHIHLQVK